ncbi:MAG: hypothetical protein AAGB34_01280 [Planctomycetota bacterium]
MNTIHSGEWPYLSQSLVNIIETLSMRGAVAFIETDYFRGVGQQCAVAWKNKETIFPLVRSKERTGLFGKLFKAFEAKEAKPINGALQSIGVTHDPGQDEFSTIGLQWFRYMDEFEDESSKYYSDGYLSSQCSAN